MQRDLMEVLQESFDKRIIFPEKVYQASYRKIMGLQEELAALKAELAELRADKRRLDWLGNEYVFTEPFDMPTGGGDADVGWRLAQEHMGKKERVVLSEEFRDDLRQTIDKAMAK